MQLDKEPIYDVCIIGGGWSGLLACKYAKENGLNPIVLEGRDDIGGVWYYTTDPNIVTVMKSTITSSSSTVTEASDFYMKKEYGSFLHQTEIYEYLHDYAKHFNLYPHIHFNSRVNEVYKENDLWITKCKNNKKIKSKNLAICVGVHQTRRENIKELSNYTGEIIHAGKIKSIDPDSFSEEDNILVYGGGETSSDIVELLVKTRAGITWAIPNGQHFFRKTNYRLRPGLGLFQKNGVPLDEASSRLMQTFIPFRKGKCGMKWICNLMATGSSLNYEGHGIPEWKKGIPILHAFLNKNGHVLDFVHLGRVKAQGLISKCDGKRVYFANGKSEEFNKIIACTGYEKEIPFVPKNYNFSFENLYKLVFTPEDSSLLYIGFARPVIGSIPFMTELQCQYAFKVLSGKLSLPSPKKMMKIAIEDARERDEYFYHKRRPPTLVESFSYVYDLGELAGTKPNLIKLLFSNPIAYLKVVAAPLGPAHFALNDPKKRDMAIKHIWEMQKFQWMYAPFAFLICRLIFLDHIIDFFAERKYRKQIEQATICQEDDSS